MKRATMLMVCVTASACASGGTRPGVADYGTWIFRETVDQTRPPLLLEGKIFYLPDTVYVESALAPCTYHVQGGRERWIYYRCGAVTFGFERADPLRHNSYATVTTVTAERTVCARTGFDRQGREVCLRQNVERYPQSVSRTGVLRPIRP